MKIWTVNYQLGTQLISIEVRATTYEKAREIAENILSTAKLIGCYPK